MPAGRSTRHHRSTSPVDCLISSRACSSSASGGPERRRGARSRHQASSSRSRDAPSGRPSGLAGQTSCAGSAGTPAYDGSTPTASATPSPPEPSRTTHANSMASTCSGTARRRWCVATARPTAAPRPLNATRRSRPATGCSSGRAEQRSEPHSSSPWPCPVAVLRERGVALPPGVQSWDPRRWHWSVGNGELAVVVGTV